MKRRGFLSALMAVPAASLVPFTVTATPLLDEKTLHGHIESLGDITEGEFGALVREFARQLSLALREQYGGRVWSEFVIDTCMIGREFKLASGERVVFRDQLNVAVDPRNPHVAGAVAAFVQEIAHSVGCPKAFGMLKHPSGVDQAVSVATRDGVVVRGIVDYDPQLDNYLARFDVIIAS